MAYTLRQRQIAAYQLALAGMNVAKAAAALKAGTIEAGGIGETTLSRWLGDPEFQAEVQRQTAIVREELETGTRNAERARLKRDLSDTFAGRVQQMEAAWWEMFEQLRAAIDQPDVDKKELLAFWAKAGEHLARLKNQRAPAVAEMWQAEALIRAYQTVLLRLAGPALTEKVQKQVGAEYQRLSLERENADAAQAPVQNA